MPDSALPVAVRTLLVVLGDQLAPDHPGLQGLDPTRDRLWMAEVAEESRHAPSHIARTALFLSAMRHFAKERRDDGFSVHYCHLGERPEQALNDALRADLEHLQPQHVRVLQPGEHRVLRQLQAACADQAIPLEVLDDPHFLVPLDAFHQWAKGRKQLRMEYFYREQRKALLH